MVIYLNEVKNINLVFLWEIQVFTHIFRSLYVFPDAVEVHLPKELDAQKAVAES